MGFIGKKVDKAIEQGKDAVQKILYVVELPHVLGENLENWKSEKAFLDYNSINETIDNLNDYRSAIKGLPNNFNELKRISENFCTHIEKSFKAYKKAMVSDVDSGSFEKYKERLCGVLDDIHVNCNNRNVLKLKKDYYQDVFEAQNVKFDGDNSFLGDFAEALGRAAKKTNEKISALKNLEDKIDGKPLFNALDVANLSKFKKLTVGFGKPSARSISDAFGRAVSGAISGAKKMVSRIFVQENLEPVEYYRFDIGEVLGRSEVHAILNILKSYLVTMKGYSSGVKKYVTSCTNSINNVIAILNSYLASLEVFENPNSSRTDQIKANQNMQRCLDDLRALRPDDKDQSLFVLVNTVKDKEKPPKYERSSEYKSLRTHWPEGCSDKNVNNVQRVLIGWSYGDFLLEVLKVVERTKKQLDTLLNLSTGSIDYNKLGIKQPKAASNQDKKTLKNIQEILSRAVTFRNQVTKIYQQTQVLGQLRKFREDTKDEYNKLFGNDGEYVQFIKTFDDLSTCKLAGETKGSRVIYCLIDHSRICMDISSIEVHHLNAVLAHCTLLFAELSRLASIITATCERWLKNYSKEVKEFSNTQAKSKAASEKELSKRIQLFKKTFAGKFKQIKAICDEANKKFDKIIKSEMFDSGDDVSANYQKKLSSALHELLHHGVVLLDFEYGPLVVFGPEGLNEDNLSNGIRTFSKMGADDYNAFLKTAEEVISRDLKVLQNDLSRFEKQCSEILNLFGKKNAEKLRQERAVYNDSIKALEGAIDNYKKVCALYERFDSICKHVPDIASSKDESVTLFRTAYANVQESFTFLINNNLVSGNHSINRSYVLEHPILTLSCSTKIGDIAVLLKDMRKLLPKIESLAESMQNDVAAASTAGVPSEPRAAVSVHRGHSTSESRRSGALPTADKLFQDLQGVFANYQEYRRLMSECNPYAEEVGFNNTVRSTPLEEFIRGTRLHRKKEQNKQWESHEKQYKSFKSVYEKISDDCKIFTKKSVISSGTVDAGKISALSPMGKEAFQKLIAKSNGKNYNKKTLGEICEEFNTWSGDFKKWVDGFKEAFAEASKAESGK